MKLSRLAALCTLLLSSVAALALPATNNDGTGTPLTVATPTQVPGKTLKPGNYRIRVVDHLSDRMIIQVNGPGGSQTFLALPKSGLPSGSQGPITLQSKGKQALRGFTFPDGTVAEFVYPKSEAVSLAKSNDTTIPAVDPASEGRSADPNLSRTDMEMVTLWMLTPEPVGPGNSGPAISAAKYQQPAAPAVSSTPRASDSSYSSNSSAAGGTASNSRTTAPTQVASVTRPRAPRPKPLMAALPHTGSNAPLLELTSLFALFAAFGLALGRRGARA